MSFYATECSAFADSAIAFPIHFLWGKKLEPAFLRVGSSWVALDDLWWESESQVKDVGIGKLALLTAFYSCVTGTSSWSSPRRGCECC